MEVGHDSEKEVIVDYAGSLFRAHKVRGSLYACPICKSALFYNEKDLIRHIVSHAMANEEAI